MKKAKEKRTMNAGRKCRVCGCTDNDCRGCIEKTGEPCYWVEEDLCSACAEAPRPSELFGRLMAALKTSPYVQVIADAGL